MKKIALLFLIILVIISCNSVAYTTDYDVKRQGVNFREGKWLLAEIDCPSESSSELRSDVSDYFSSILKSNFTSFSPTKTALLSKKVEINPSVEILKRIKKETIYNYLINVKGEKIREELSSIDLTNHNFTKGLNNQVAVTLEIYDLDKSEIIYSRKYFGTTEIKEGNNSDLNFNKSTTKMIQGCFKKLTKDLNKKSVK